MEVTHLGVVGAGTMGHGIAQVAAQAGLAVTLVDVAPAALERGLAGIGKSLDRLIAKGKL
ncbi:MAG: 3-hydroxyacyl-CoA dehydrogenase NAD-binding domain-containing protein, partial [bacterium]